VTRLRISPDEITKILKERIEGYEKQANLEETGRVVQVGDAIAAVYGLKKVKANEIVEFDNGTLGIALNLEEDTVGVVALGEYSDIREGSIVKRTGKIIAVNVGKELLGRVVNPLGQPIDGKGSIKTNQNRDIEIKAPGVIERQPVDTPLQTGLKSIDSMIPIGRGQRELIIGDRQTGKTQIALDTIINQKGKGVNCVYVAIGQKTASVARIVDQLEKYGAMEYTTVVLASASDPAALLYIAPYA
jgi:F-type H+-transporting ATPase subunit alpha